MPAEHVNITAHQAEFIRASIDTGRYEDVDEVIRAALRLLEQSEQEDALKLDVLRRIAEDSFDAIDRGEFTLHTPQSLHDLAERIHLEVRSEHGHA